MFTLSQTFLPKGNQFIGKITLNKINGTSAMLSQIISLSLFWCLNTEWMMAYKLLIFGFNDNQVMPCIQCLGSCQAVCSYYMLIKWVTKWMMYQQSIAVGQYYHKLKGLKPYTFIITVSVGQEAGHNFPGFSALRSHKLTCRYWLGLQFGLYVRCRAKYMHVLVRTNARVPAIGLVLQGSAQKWSWVDHMTLTLNHT